MSFWNHLEELRKRITCSAHPDLIGFGLCFNYSEDILRVLLWPMNTKMEPTLVYPFVKIFPNATPQKLSLSPR